jgi:uncharacterized protein YbjT (DUF2867 family)
MLPGINLRIPAHILSYARVGEDGLDFRAEQQGLPIVAVIEWLDPQPITRQKQAPLIAVPNREGKHSAQVGDAVRSIFFIQMNDGFGVASGTITVTAGLEILP